MQSQFAYAFPKADFEVIAEGIEIAFRVHWALEPISGAGPRV